MSEIPKIGEIFDDKYEIEEILGSGGNGAVFKARQLDCGRTIALKILHHETALDEEYRLRFVREAQALSKLSHTNIVTVYHLGVSSSNLPYLAMEYVTGQSIRMLINAADHLSVLQSLKIVRDAARAMSYVHQQDIVHRDLKPENMLITQVPDPDTVKLIDFGLVRLTNQQNQKLTSTGELLGTSKYMSPEQCMGKAVDFRTDIYSLSCCLYEMIAGRAPFDADTPVGLMYKHINEPVPEIDSTKVDLFHPRLNNMVSKGMSKDPQHRFGSMEEMANQIDETIGALHASGASRRLARPQRIVAGFVLLCAVACSVIIMGKINQNRFIDGKELHPKSLKNQTENKYERDYKFYQRALARSEKAYGPEHPAVTARLDDMANALRRQKKYAEAGLLLKRSLTIKEKAFGLGTPSVANSAADLAECFKDEGKYAEAEPLYKRSLAIMENILGPDHENVAGNLEGLAGCCRLEGKWAKAESLYKRALAIREKTFQPNDTSNTYFLVCNLILLAECYEKQNRFSEAEPLLQRSLAIREEALGPNNPDIAGSLESYAHLLRITNRNAEAAKLEARAQAIRGVKQ